jgi:hypothetical protein
MKFVRWKTWIAGAVALLSLAALISVAFFAPALAAAGCPRCYGMEPVRDGLFVDRQMPVHARKELIDSIVEAEAMVSAFFGQRSRRPTILACSSDVCDRLLGGGGARAITYSSFGFSVLRLSPKGLNTTIAAHELSHVEVHARIGALAQMRGVVPAWFDEGLAVLVSEDKRYLKAGASSDERCLKAPDQEPPVSPFVWGPLAGRAPWIYAQAACQVLRWMEANGGKAGLLAAIDEVATAQRQLP